MEKLYIVMRSKTNSNKNILWTLLEKAFSCEETKTTIVVQFNEALDEFHKCHHINIARLAHKQSKVINLFNSTQRLICLFYCLSSTRRYVTINDYVKSIVVNNIWLYNLSFRHAVFR